MDKLDRIKILLDNSDLMSKHHYTERDVEELSLSGRHKHPNEFIEFMIVSINSMEGNKKETNRTAAGRLINHVDKNIF